MNKSKKKDNLINKAIEFIKYHNGFTIGLMLIFVFSGAIFASEDVRDAVIGQAVVTQNGIDNTALLAANLDNFDLAMTIRAVSEDDNNYYIDYSFNTLGIGANVWQEMSRVARMTVSKIALAGRDLGLYITEELGEITDYELAYLRQVQQAEKEKGETRIVETTEYTGLIGLVLNTKEKVLPGYQPVIPEPEPEICDGKDNDLNGEIDEGLATYSGSDIGQCQYGIIDCVNGSMVQTQTEIGPSDEACNDGKDNNCDGSVDENCCKPITEICNNLDDDCDGLVDEDFGQINCGVGVCFRTIQGCVAGVIQNCVPGTPTTEICDGIDNDCDGEVDEDNVCQPLPEIPPIDTTTPPSEGATPPPAEDVCDSTHLNLCTTQELCEGVSLYWYNETCNNEPAPPACVPNWQCSDWQPLPETIACGQTFTQTRTCVDLNECGSEDNKPAEQQEAVGTDAGACASTLCDANLNLAGECQNTCVEGTCQTCTPTCACADGFSDCDSDISNGCEVQGDCLPAEQ